MNTTKRQNAKRLLKIASGILFLIASFNLYKANVVTVTSDMPDNVQPGATIPVTITINKGSIDGFGRYTNTLPKGFTATSNDANFSFSDNTVTLLWVKLPHSGTFSFTYNIHVPEKTKNSFTFTAKFGYVENNEKKFAELTPKNINISENAPEIPIANETNQKIDYDAITCYRTIGIINNEATISVNINKSNTNTMCKIEEMLPDGYSFTALDNAGSEVSTVANIARFMWKESPQNNHFSVTYKVKANKGYDINDLYINGAFSVFATDGTKSFIILDKDSRIDESTGYVSVSDNKQIQVSSQENIADEKTRKELEQQQYTAEQAEFFANASAVNSLKPTKTEINNFQNNLDIPAPTTQSAEKQYELTQKEEKTYDISEDTEKQYEITQTTETTTTKEIVSESKTPALINNIMSPSSAKPTMTTIDAEPSEITQTTTQTTVTTTTTTIKPVQATKEAEKKVASTTTTASPVATKATPAKKSTTTLSNKNNNSQEKTKVATTNAKNNKVTYRVQVAASHKQLKNAKNFFAKRNINEKVSVEHIDNWYKYTINSFDQYTNARNHRNSVWEQTPVKGAFVVAYNGTKRITVQEALMLTNQKWVK